MRYQIRPAVPGDAASLRAMIQALAEYEREPDAVEVTDEQLAEQLSADNPPFHCFIAESDDQTPIGFALYFFSYSTWRGRPGIYLEDLFVMPKARRLGVGHALMKALMEVGCAHTCARLEWSVLDWNEPALAFYRALDAQPMDEWTTWRIDLSSS